MKKLISLLMALAMLAAFVPAVVAAEAVATEVATGVATAEADSRCVVSFEATEPGTLTITVGDGKEAWSSDVYNFVDWSVSASVSGTEEKTYTYEVTALGSYMIRIYGPVNASGVPAAISKVPYSITFTPSGAAVEPALDPYSVVDATITEEGTYDVAIAATAKATLYPWAPAATGTYEIALVSGNAAMSLWSTASYGKIADAAEGVLTVNATAVGQEWFIAFESDEAAAQFKITKTAEVSDEPAYETVSYENKQTAILFDDEEYELEDFVDYTDAVVDTAVLGADGYYHLNSADGPVLYVDFFGVEPSLGTAWSFGNVSYAEYDDNGAIVTAINYQEALGEYLMAENTDGILTYGNMYHPLTEDLIEMLKNIGTNNNWYGANGMVGNTEDAWMFALVLMSSLNEEENAGGNTGNENTGNENNGNTGTTEPTEPSKPEEKPEEKPETPETGDFGILAAVIAMAASAAGAVVISKKKEN
ncbi:MAG: hypothetical protein J6Q54_00930 [Oscillospiraceae bacterium]|nr:hypothetical protein [Oscillospiraceae bacterium]